MTVQFSDNSNETFDINVTFRSDEYGKICEFFADDLQPFLGWFHTNFCVVANQIVQKSKGTVPKLKVSQKVFLSLKLI